MSLFPTSLFFSAFLIFQVQSDYLMTVTFGEPQNYTGSNTYSSSWTNCLAYCLSNTSCFAIYELNDDNCQVFTIDQITSAKRLSNGNHMGFKHETNSTTCPVELTSVEQDTTYELTDTTYKSYTATYNGSNWAIKVVESLSCPTNFTIFRRSLGFWCLQLIDTGGCYTRAGSSTTCKKIHKGSLSGPENSNEYNFLLEKVLVIWKRLSGYTILAVWVDGYRKSECSTYSNRTATCNGTNEFFFTDPTLSTVPQGYKWLTNQPSGLHFAEVTEFCVAMKINNLTDVGMDDCGCNAAISGDKSTCIRGYLCGLTPTSG